MKKCSDCKEYKPESEFYWRNKEHTILNSKCKLCSNNRMTELRRERTQQVATYKASKKCKICGEARPWCLDLHHRDGDNKERAISDMLRKNMSWENIKAEMDKCDVLCANCHRDYHYHNK